MKGVGRLLYIVFLAAGLYLGCMISIAGLVILSSESFGGIIFVAVGLLTVWCSHLIGKWVCEGFSG